MHKSVFLATAIATLVGAAQAQFTVVIPNGMATAEGSTSNAFPWGRGGTGLRLQTIYDSSNFTAQGVNYPIIISRLRWRPNTNVSSAASSYPTGATVQLSTCPVDQSAVTTTFANNQGADLTTVFSGPVSWPAATAVAGPCPFLIDIPFTSNFVYDPSLGDLNIETDIPIQTFTGTGLQLDVHGSSPMASRVYLSTGYANGGPNATGLGVTLNHGVVVEVTYNPAAGMYPAFSATPTRGASPLSVQFTDRTFTSDPGGVLAWQWDLDGDSIIDSTQQNPAFVYTGCGSYNVSLTTIDATHGAVTVTRPNFVITDLVVADFTYTVLPGNAVAFTDLSTPTPTTWAWDFDGDSVIDSTAQNPAFVFPTQNPYNTSLTASRLCGAPSTVTKSVTAALQVSTMFTGGNGGATGWGVLFDCNVTNPTGIVLTAMDHNISSAASTPFTVDVYITPGTYVGAQTNGALWRLVATGSGVGVGANLPTPTPLSNPVFLAPGSYGMAVYYNGASMSYTNGTGTNQSFGNGDLTLTLGESRTTLWGTGVNTPRVWNGAIYYDKLGFANRAGYTFFQSGCAGTLGMTNLVASSAPVLGQTMTVNLNSLPTNLAIMVFGFSRTTSAFGPLPLNLGFLGAPGCLLRVSNDANFAVFGAGNAAAWNVPIPNLASLVGMQFYNQAFVFDAAANGLGAVVSDAAAATVGL